MEIAPHTMAVDDVVRRLIPDIADFQIDRKLTSRHQQIFQSFRYRKCAKPTGKPTAETAVPAKKCSSKDDVIEFYLDKGPSSRADSSEDGEKNNLEVVTVDLSNIEQSDSESVTDTQDKAHAVENDTEENGDYAIDLMEHYTGDSKEKQKKKKRKEKEAKGSLSSRLHANISEDDLYVNVDPFKRPGNVQLDKKHPGRQQEPEIMKKSVISNDFENQETIETSHKSIRELKKQRKLEREKTKGDKWFNMPATELTEERKNDYAVIQMRKALDPKRFYKANDFKVAPKYFQFGEVVESAADFYSSRLPKKQRKATVVEELLADAQFRQYNKRKYEEIQEAKRQGQGPYKHMKRMKKKKK